jgi:DNA-binding response OmpR family regulator
MALQVSYMGLADPRLNATIRFNMANIVVIEDHPPVLKLLATLCRAEGHEVMAFDNGRAGLEAIREMAPDLALVDRRLGDVDGLDMIRDAREASPKTRYVMVSACSETRDIVTAVRRGVCDYVTKPFEPEEIKSAVSRALNEPNEPQPISRQKLVILCPKQAA